MTARDVNIDIDEFIDSITQEKVSNYPCAAGNMKAAKFYVI